MPFVGYPVGYETNPHRSNPNRYIVRYGRKWRARPICNGRRHDLGYFATEHEARRARDAFLAEHRQPVRFVKHAQEASYSNTPAA